MGSPLLSPERYFEQDSVFLPLWVHLTLNRSRASCLPAQASPDLAHPHLVGHCKPTCVRSFKTILPTVCGMFRGPGTQGEGAGKPPAQIPFLRRPWGGEPISGRARATQGGRGWRGRARFRTITGKSARSYQPRQGCVHLETRCPQEWVQLWGLPLGVPSSRPGGRGLPLLEQALQVLPWEESGALRGKMAPGSRSPCATGTRRLRAQISYPQLPEVALSQASMSLPVLAFIGTQGFVQ